MIFTDLRMRPDGGFFPDGDPMLPPGDGPFTLWIDNANGTLTEVATLTDYGSAF
jgi:hypothetical protein